MENISNLTPAKLKAEELAPDAKLKAEELAPDAKLKAEELAPDAKLKAERDAIKKQSDQIFEKLLAGTLLKPLELEITEMDLSGENLTTLPENMNLLRSLTSLNLSNNPLLFKDDEPSPTEDVPQASITTFYQGVKNKLHHIYSSSEKNSQPLDNKDVNRIVAKTEDTNVTIEQPSKCKSKCKLTIEILSTLQSLTSLNLSQNNLTSLPDEISSLEKLESLNLSTNELEELPETIPAISQLQILNLSNNAALKKLPVQLNALQNLVIFDLKQSGILLNTFLNTFKTRRSLPLYVSIDVNIAATDANNDKNIVYTNDILDNVILFEDVDALIDAFQKLPVSYTFEKYNPSLIEKSKPSFIEKYKPSFIEKYKSSTDNDTIKTPSDILLSFNKEICKTTSCQIKAEFKPTASIDNTIKYKVVPKVVPKTVAKGGSTSKKTKKSRKSTKKTKRRKHKKH